MTQVQVPEYSNWNHKNFLSWQIEEVEMSPFILELIHSYFFFKKKQFFF